MKAVGERKLGAGDARLSLSGLGQLVLPQPSPHSWAPHSWGPSQERARLEAEEQASFLDAPPRAEPGSQTLPPSINCGHEVIFFPLLIKIICFQFPDKFIEFPLSLGPLGCTVWIYSCGPDLHCFIFLGSHGPSERPICVGNGPSEAASIRAVCRPGHDPQGSWGPLIFSSWGPG